MYINKNEPNYVEVEVEDKVILFSYKTPVAIFYMTQNFSRVSEEKFSKTTSKHIKTFVEHYNIKTKVYNEQAYLDSVVRGI